MTPGREVEISLSLSLLRSQSCRPNRAGALVHWCGRVAEWQGNRVALQSASSCIHLHPPASACIHLHPPAEWQSGTAESTIIRRDRWVMGETGEAQLWQLQSNHMIKCIGVKMAIRCENCPTVFNTAVNLKVHMTNKSCEIQCNLCDKTLKREGI